MGTPYQEAGGRVTHRGEKHDLNAMFRKAHGRPVTMVPVSKLSPRPSSPCLSCRNGPSSWHGERVRNADLKAPLTVTADHGRFIILDGIHRRDKAVAMGVPELPAVVLSASEVAMTKQASDLSDLRRMSSLVEMARKDPYIGSHIGDKTHRLPIRNDDGEVVGFFTPRKSEDGTLRVGSTFVHPAHRGKGFAGKALKKLVGTKASRAFINTDNVASRKLFLSAGFKQSDPEERWGGGHWFRRKNTDAVIKGFLDASYRHQVAERRGTPRR